jgi:hypothetical protein
LGFFFEALDFLDIQVQLHVEEVDGLVAAGGVVLGKLTQGGTLARTFIGLCAPPLGLRIRFACRSPEPLGG